MKRREFFSMAAVGATAGMMLAGSAGAAGTADNRAPAGGPGPQPYLAADKVGDLPRPYWSIWNRRRKK